MGPLDVLSLENAKQYLTIDFPDWDDQITAAIIGMVDMVEQITNYRLYQRDEVIQVGVKKYDAFQFPLNTIVSVTDNNGYPTSGYQLRVLPLRHTFEFYKKQKYIYADEFPELFSNQCLEYHVLTLNVGYSDVTKIPQALVSAVKLLITEVIENRIPNKAGLPNSVQVLLQPYLRSTLF